MSKIHSIRQRAVLVMERHGRKSFVDQLQKIWPVLAETTKDDVARAICGFLMDDYDEMCMRRIVNDDKHWIPIDVQTMLNEIQQPDRAFEHGHRYLRKESSGQSAAKMKFMIDDNYKEKRLIALVAKAYGQGDELIPLDKIVSRLGLEGWHILKCVNSCCPNFPKK